METEIAERAAELAEGKQEQNLGADEAQRQPSEMHQVFRGDVEVKAQLKSDPE